MKPTAKSVLGRSLSDFYVFYKRLGSESGADYKTVYKRELGKVKGINKQLNSKAKRLEVGNQLKAVAAQERAKELALLRELFGVDLSSQIGKRGFAQQLINTINACLNIKSVYERNLKLLLDKDISRKEKITISYFPTYFVSAWNELKIVDIINNNIRGCRNNEVIGERINKVLDQYLPQVMDLALEKMLVKARAETDRGNNKASASNAYLEFYKAIQQLGNQSLFKNTLYDIFKINEIKDALSVTIGKKRNTTRLEKFDLKKYMTRNTRSTSGITYEAYAAQVYELIASTHFKGNETMKPHIETSVYHTGSTKMRPDIVSTYNIDVDLTDILESDQTGRKSTDVALFREIGERLKKFDKGFIVYTNAKNYYLKGQKGGDFEGFHGTTEFNIRQLADIINRFNATGLPKNDLIEALVQLTDGAIGSDKSLRTNIESFLAEQIAYILFDDVDTIGVQNGGARAIHLLDLNGVIFPLSVMLETLANAFTSYFTKIKESVDIQINSTTILFQTNKDEVDYIVKEYGSGKTDSGDPEVAWAHQREDTLDNTKIAVLFLRGIQDILASIMR